MATSTWITKFFVWIEQQENALTELKHNIVVLKTTQQRQQNEIENLQALVKNKCACNQESKLTSQPSPIKAGGTCDNPNKVNHSTQKPIIKKKKEELTIENHMMNDLNSSEISSGLPNRKNTKNKNISIESKHLSKNSGVEDKSDISGSDHILFPFSNDNNTWNSNSSDSPILLAKKRRKNETKDIVSENVFVSNEEFIPACIRIRTKESCSQATTMNNGNGNEKEGENENVKKELMTIQKNYLTLMKGGEKERQREREDNKSSLSLIQQQLTNYVDSSEIILKRIEENNDISKNKDMNVLLAYCHALIGNALYHCKIKYQLLSMLTNQNNRPNFDFISTPQVQKAFSHARKAIDLDDSGYRGWILLAELTFQCQQNLSLTLQILDNALLKVNEKTKILQHKHKIMLAK